MNQVNTLATTIFGWILLPFAWMGEELALFFVSGCFGILALLAFKQISWQKGIKQAKDYIKGHLIAIRLFQDDLPLVAVSVGKILLGNLRYLFLNFAPILPLAAPFTLIAAQLVVRYAFDPLPVQSAQQAQLAGQGTTLTIEMLPEELATVSSLRVDLPAGLRAVSPLVRSNAEGKAWLEFVAERPGIYEVQLSAGGSATTKQVVAGELATPLMQPERVSSFWAAWLWPAEPTLEGTPFARVSFVYPDRPLAYMPDGVGGVLLVFLIAAMLFGIAIMKPLGIEI